MVAKSKLPKRRTAPLYSSAKISEYHFRKLLWHFVRDHTATETAKSVKVSINSIAAIFAKLRRYFFAVNLFTDFHKGGDPRDGSGDPDKDEYEFRLIDFHLKRAAAKRMNSDEWGEPYNFAESHWRFHYWILEQQRPSEAIHDMMMAHLLEVIRACGPVGRKPTNPDAGAALAEAHLNQRLLWLERNSPDYRSPEKRQAIQEIRSKLKT